MKQLSYLIAVLFLPVFVKAQTHVVPPAYTTVDANGSFLGPLASSTRTYMLLIHADQLTPMVGMEITGLTFRSSAATSTSWPAASTSATNYDIYLAEGVAPANRSLNSLNDNYTGTPVQVRSGSLSIAANSYPAGGPSSFGPTISFTTPYLYTGGHLYLRISHDGISGTSRSVNAITASGGPAGVYGVQVSAGWASSMTPTTLQQGNAAIVQFTYTSGTPVSSVTVATQGGAAPSITTNGATLQMVAQVLPATAFQGVNWSIVPGTGQATISASGEITPVANGTVWAKAVSMADATKKDSMQITISNQVIPITSLTVSTQGGVPATITSSTGSLQMQATILPSFANQNVVWSIVPITGDANITTGGLVTGINDGLVWAKAVSVENPAFRDSMQIALTNQQVPVSSIDVVTLGGVPAAINTNGGTLQLIAEVLPANASNPAVSWSVTSGTGAATINSTGLVTAISNGTVTARAISVENNSISDSLVITITNQGVSVSNVEHNDKFELYPNPTSAGILNIKFEQGFAGNKVIQFTITDLSGKVIQTGKITEDNTQINITEFAAGNYFINIKGDSINARRTITRTK